MGPTPSPLKESTAELNEVKVIRKEDDVPYSKVWIGWISPALYQKGDAELDILSSLLTDGKDSLLYNELVTKRQLVKEISAYQYSARLHGQYFIEATAAEGHTTDEIVNAIDDLLTSFLMNPPDAEEIRIAKFNWEVNFYTGLQSIASKANQLNTYNIYTGNPGYIEQDLQRYMDVTPQSVWDTSKTVLSPKKRIILHVTPKLEKETSGGENK